jgi:PAP2 superfamily protein
MDPKSATAPDDVDAAWHFLLFNWIIVGALTATLALCVMVTKFSIGWLGVLIAIGYVGIYAGFAHANARSRKRRDPQIMFVLGATAQIVLITAVMAPMTYVAAAINFPMQDATLLAVDRAMGLDWAAYVHFVDARPVLARCLNCGYIMIGWPLFAIPVFLAAKRRYQRIEEFTFAFALALVATTIISALVPAIGVYQQIGLDPGTLKNINPGAYLDQLRDLPPTRDGVLRQLDLLGLGGIVTFPSFHAASAVLFAWALWVVKWMRPVALLANGAMLAATPLNGGHYFIDVFAGMVVAVLAIVAARRIGQIIARRQMGFALPKPMLPAIVPAE